MIKLIAQILEYFTHASTYQAITVFLTVLGVNISPEHSAVIASGGALIFGGIKLIFEGWYKDNTDAVVEVLKAKKH